jgi:hypothetical protein
MIAMKLDRNDADHRVARHESRKLFLAQSFGARGSLGQH